MTESNATSTLIAGIHSRQKCRVAFMSKEDGGKIVRTCAPLDYGPTRRYKDGLDRLHFFDYDSDTKPHPVMLLPEAVIECELLDETFDPADIITWDVSKYPWNVARDWGRFS